MYVHWPPQKKMGNATIAPHGTHLVFASCLELRQFLLVCLLLRGNVLLQLLQLFLVLRDARNVRGKLKKEETHSTLYQTAPATNKIVGLCMAKRMPFRYCGGQCFKNQTTCSVVKKLICTK
jgi:hypothetical protein